MRISKLHVTNYRCFNDLLLDELGRFVCLVGANGSGKSSVLELVVQLCGSGRPRRGLVNNEWNGDIKDETLNLVLNMTNDDIEAMGLSATVVGSRILNSESGQVQLFDIGTNEFGTVDEFNQEVQNALQSRIVFYSPNRSFLLPEASGPQEAAHSSADMYRRTGLANFQDRAVHLSTQMARLLRHQQSDLARRVKESSRSQTSFDATRYVELQEVEDVFNRFFRITGKRFADSDQQENGMTTFFFHLPWSDEPISFSKLSSGEQWILLFFVEMQLNEWNNNIVLIDEVETHLHPMMALEFIRELESREDDNQYWFTTHNPTIAQYLKGSVFGLVLNDELRSEVVPGQTLELLESLTGLGAVIPVAKTIVLLEGKRVKGETLSVDQGLFKELQDLNLISENIQFVSVGHSRSVESYQEMLPEVEQQLNVGWKIYAIRDRDALSDSQRDEMIQKFGGRFWVWRRGSIEGYLIEPRLIHDYLEQSRIDPLPSVEDIQERIIELLNGNKADIIQRYERQLIRVKLEQHYTIKQLGEVEEIGKELQTNVEEFRESIDKWLEGKEWEPLLAYVDCKKVLRPLISRYTKKTSTKPKDVADLVRRMIRDVIGRRVHSGENGQKVLQEMWPEITGVVAQICDGEGFHSLPRNE